MAVAAGFMQSKALEAACRLDVAALLATAGPDGLPAAPLAGRRGVKRAPLERLLRALSSVGIFRQVSPGKQYPLCWLCELACCSQLRQHLQCCNGAAAALLLAQELRLL